MELLLMVASVVLAVMVAVPMVALLVGAPCDGSCWSLCGAAMMS